MTASKEEQGETAEESADEQGRLANVTEFVLDVLELLLDVF